MGYNMETKMETGNKYPAIENMQIHSKTLGECIKNTNSKGAGLTLRASAEVLEFINPERGITFGELFISDLADNDLDSFLLALSGKFRSADFFDAQTTSHHLAIMTFDIAKDEGISSERFKKQVRAFVVNFKYGVNNWQPDDILKLSEMPRLYPYDWVMKQMKDEPKIWEKVQGYEVGSEVLYAWKWDSVPLKKFYPKQAKIAEAKQEVPALENEIKTREKTVYSFYLEMEKENKGLRNYLELLKNENLELRNLIEGQGDGDKQN